MRKPFAALTPVLVGMASGYGGPLDGPPNYGGPGYSPPGGFYGGDGEDPRTTLRKQSDLWFILALLSVPCCCVFGIAGAVLAYQGKDLVAQNRFSEAESKIHAAKVVTLVGLSLAGFVVLLQISLMIVPLFLRRP